MPTAHTPKSAVHLSLADHRAKAAWRRAAWIDDSDDEQLRSAARTVESINALLAEFHRLTQTRHQDLAGYLWSL